MFKDLLKRSGALVLSLLLFMSVCMSKGIPVQAASFAEVLSLTPLNKLASDLSEGTYLAEAVKAPTLDDAEEEAAEAEAKQAKKAAKAEAKKLKEQQKAGSGLDVWK